MAQLTWSITVGIAGQAQPLLGWQYEYVPFGGVIKILHWSVLVTMLVVITSGSDTLQEQSPVPANNPLAGTVPSEFNVAPIEDEVAAGDRLKILYTNNNAAANVVDGVIIYTPTPG